MKNALKIIGAFFCGLMTLAGLFNTISPPSLDARTGNGILTLVFFIFTVLLVRSIRKTVREVGINRTVLSAMAVGVFLVGAIALTFLGDFVWGIDESRTLQFPDWYTVLIVALPILLAVLFVRQINKSILRSRVNMVATSNKSDTESSAPHTQEQIVPPHDMATNKVHSKAPDEMDLIRSMEREFSITYKYAFERMLNKQDCLRAYSLLSKKWGSDTNPIPVQIRFKQLQEEYEPKFANPNPMLMVDNMDGHTFEHWCADLLLKNGFSSAEVTPGSGDQGVDIIAVKDDIRYAIQCKCYSSDLGNKPVQEVTTGKAIYHCQVGAVMTNQYFTSGAKEAAAATGTLLWSRDKLVELLEHQQANAYR